MNYTEAVRYLYELRLFGMKLELENTRRLAAMLGDPQLRLRFIHVAGTNGKGSTCAMLESIYRAAGLRVGLFTSPHLISFAERIQVNRTAIPHDDVSRLTEQLRGVIESFDAENRPTFFEAVTAMALQYFAEQKCDLVIWETGLGGRLDATNIVTPLASVITNVQLDHQKWLGQTVAEIAVEKAGIIKAGVPVFTSAQDRDALRVISETARTLAAPLTLAADGAEGFEVALPGEHQRINAGLAVAVARALGPTIPVSEAAIREGLRTTHWAGRMQLLQQPGGRTVVLDGAHNPAGARALAAALRTQFGSRRPVLVIGTMGDKDYAGICSILAPLASQILIPPVSSQRGADPEWLADLCRRLNSGAPVTICSSVADALGLAAGEPFVVITGSLYLIGDAMVELGLAESTGEAGLNDYATRLDRRSIRAVTFDVGGTLIEPWPSVGDVYAQVARRHGIDVSATDLNRQFAAAWKAKKDFGYSMSDWSDLVRQTFAGLAGGSPGEALFAELYEHFATAAPWRIFDDVLPCLRALKRRGIKLGVISNWDDRLRPLLRALGLEENFEVILVSGELGCHKPDAKVFEAAARQLGITAGEILHVGDSAEEDFEGARNAGMRAVLLRRGQTTSRDAVPSLHVLECMV